MCAGNTLPGETGTYHCDTGHRNGLASLCMDGSVDSLGAIDNSYIFEYIDQLVAPAVPFVLMPCCLFTCCCCFFYKSFGTSFSQQSIWQSIEHGRNLTTRSWIEIWKQYNLTFKYRNPQSPIFVSMVTGRSPRSHAVFSVFICWTDESYELPSRAGTTGKRRFSTETRFHINLWSMMIM